MIFRMYSNQPDVLVQSSLWEGMPNSVLEAMAAGLAVVSTTCRGCRGPGRSWPDWLASTRKRCICSLLRTS